LRTSGLGYNYPALRTWKNTAVKRTGVANNRRFYESHGVSVFIGRAHFITPHEITVNRRHLSAKKFLIASGAEWSVPTIKGLQDIPFYTPRTILETLRPPKSILIIGGGEDGIEIAQLLSTFGTKVYLTEQRQRLLPREEPETSELIEKVLEKQGVSVLTRSKVIAVNKEDTSIKIIISRGGMEKFIRSDEVLVATGHIPMVDLGLNNASVTFDEKGIKVNRYLQTTARHIYAAGSVLGRHQQTHTAILEGQVAAHNLLSFDRITPNYTAITRLISTYPEIAHTGLTVREARKKGLSIKTGLAPLSIIGRSNIADSDDGFVKIITNENRVVIGATVVAPGAGEIIHELALAIKARLKVDVIAQTPHAFLSWSEAVRVAASKII
ncbi:MAG TPA: NAD(P)/FAD-dependent oxidoreductase, partial [Candidatus Saccharibacteria bacterium]|nr:NAD(P)/FAD-dependent oxidoreductase [Candidatus Saccharibacteria bacterium]